MRRASLAIVVALLAIASPASARFDQNSFMEEPRFRFGLEVGVGALIDAGGLGAFAFGGELRAGIQFDDTFALFAASRLTGGVTGADGSAATLFVGGGMLGFDVTIEDQWQVGAGIGVDGMGSSWCVMRSGPCYAVDGPALGFELRVAHVLAPWAYMLRGGFPVALSWHATYVDGVGLTSSFTLSIGFEFF